MIINDKLECFLGMEIDELIHEVNSEMELDEDVNEYMNKVMDENENMTDYERYMRVYLYAKKGEDTLEEIEEFVKLFNHNLTEEDLDLIDDELDADSTLGNAIVDSVFNDVNSAFVRSKIRSVYWSNKERLSELKKLFNEDYMKQIEGMPEIEQAGLLIEIYNIDKAELYVVDEEHKQTKAAYDKVDQGVLTGPEELKGAIDVEYEGVKCYSTLDHRYTIEDAKEYMNALGEHIKEIQDQGFDEL